MEHGNEHEKGGAGAKSKSVCKAQLGGMQKVGPVSVRHTLHDQRGGSDSGDAAFAEQAS